MSFREGPVGPPDPAKRPPGLPGIAGDARAAQRAVRDATRKAQEQIVTISGGKVHRLPRAVLSCPNHGDTNAGELVVLTSMTGEMKSWDADQAECLICGETLRFPAEVLRWLRGEGITMPARADHDESDAAATIREQLERAAGIVDAAVHLSDGGGDQVAYALLIGKVFDALREDS